MSSIDSGRTYVNFSRPTRSRPPSVISMFSRRSSVADSAVGEEAQAYKPVTAKLVQLHVTTDDRSLITTSTTHTDSSRSSTIDRFARPAIPERSTSLIELNKLNRSWSSISSRQRRGVGGYKFTDVPTLTKTPWEMERGRPDSRWSRSADRKHNTPRKIFVQLPREIYQCILDHVEALHIHGYALDVLGYRRDLKALILTDRKWHQVAKDQLYRELWLPSNRAPPKRKFSTKQTKSKLKVLADTLKSNPELGFLVHRIRVPTELSRDLEVEAYAPFRQDSGIAALRDVVSQCYNLEKISGYTLPATESTTPVFEALASRTRLKSHAWSLDSIKSALPDLDSFILCHDYWSNLEMLILATDSGVDLGGLGTISGVLHRLPALKHLMLSGMHHTDFHNTSLLSLPAVKSLRLERVGGITDTGIEQIAFSRLALSLERLTLVGLELVSLHTVQILLSHLTRMKRFAIEQKISPEALKTASTRVMTLCSPSLQYLHWDCLHPGSALSWLSEAIEDGKFPKLRRVKVPCDDEGLIQSLCRPIPREKLTVDDMEYLHKNTQHGYERNLRVSQIRAQLRVRESRQQPSFNFVVQDEDNEVQSTHTIGSYLGSMSSMIEYDLRPEAGGQALAHLQDLRPTKAIGSNFEERLEASILF